MRVACPIENGFNEMGEDLSLVMHQLRNEKSSAGTVAFHVAELGTPPISMAIPDHL